VLIGNILPELPLQLLAAGCASPAPRGILPHVARNAASTAQKQGQK
jgi:hypothetical protein